MDKLENKALLKRKMQYQESYKKQAMLLDNNGKNTIMDIIKEGGICELRQRQLLDGGGETLTLKIYFENEKETN